MSSAVATTTIAQRRVLRTEIPGPRSVAMHERKLAAVSAGVGTTLPVYIARAGGGILIDVDGNHLIDLGSGLAVTSIGNSAPRVIDAVREQVSEFTHTCFMLNPYELYIAVAEELNKITPGTHEKRSLLLNAGAEAVENAVKIARYHTGRQAVVAFDHAYHGRTNLTMALTARNMPYKHRFGPFANEIYRMPSPYPFRWPSGPDRCGDEAFEQFVAQMRAQVGAENTAAVIIEPIQGEGGFIVPPDGFLSKVAAWCRDNGIVFIADEIQSGFCRTGDWFACDHEAVVPDLVVTAKGIAGGLPLSAVTGRAEIMDSVHPGGLGGTYGGNPVSCAAALAAIETMRAEDLNGAARRIDAILRNRLSAMADRYGVIGEVRGRGAMIAAELVAERGSVTANPELAAKVATACHREGVLALVTGTYGNVLRFLPPLVIGQDLLNEGLDVLDAAFAAHV
jgi:4-aminobutyrate aminotransferase / (S)-3-amino-2-methylpropionate transaminase / 5-aminovalerate transaminase